MLCLGIDVQAELRAKTGSPHLGPTNINATMQPTIQRAIMNRHHQARRSNSSIAPKVEPGASIQSPQSRPTPSSHASSPTSISPGFHPQGVMTPPGSETQAQFQQQQHQRLQAKPQPQAGHGLSDPGLIGNTGMVGATLRAKGPGNSAPGTTGGVPAATALYPAPFQNHFEQLGKLTRPLLSSFSFYRAMFVLD